ncbi:MAG: formate dehydrogenase accessory sulfurtransferase FdhD [Gammaproteobacteria bacterium]|nr:formate dehydrogenase accessory sulfurtransferase FdhD [Gammaproteobacteria bacterium]MBL7000901.1 formate dehydrogenase accessory sulfurtransferase FdhD [Gammaproteobacteria bacterium]
MTLTLRNNQFAIAPGGSTYRVLSTQRWNHGKVVSAMDCIAEEVPVALEYNRVSYAVMLATPDQLEDFAIGFSITEGIVQRLEDIHDIDIIEADRGITVRLTISSSCFRALKLKRRTLAGRTGCGLCGTENLEQLYRQLPAVESSACYPVEMLQRGFEHLNKQQQLKNLTGATHAAAWMDQTGQVTHMREDVGRHNALDKLLGCLSRERLDFSQGALLITSRASYEMVLKSALLGVGILAAISAPTGMAVRLAESSGLTLAGFVRENRLLVYSHGARLIQSIHPLESI